MSEISHEAAAHFLSSVPEQNKFWCNDGNVFSTLEELEKGLQTMNQETFKYHVNSEKNDFSSWIYDIVGDTELANALRQCKDKKAAVKKVKAKISYLKKYS